MHGRPMHNVLISVSFESLMNPIMCIESSTAEVARVNRWYVSYSNLSFRYKHKSTRAHYLDNVPDSQCV